MTRQQAEQLEEIAADAEELAYALEENPVLPDETDTVEALRELALHHHAAAPSAIRIIDDTTSALVLDSMLERDRANLQRIHEQLDEAAEAAVRAERRWRRQLRLAIIGAAILLVALAEIGWLWATRVW
jgi:hypothetical protein